MTSPKNYYKILGVNSSASMDEIKFMFRKQIKKHHPDITGNYSNNVLVANLYEAYNTLSDHNKRRAYDLAFFEEKSNTNKFHIVKSHILKKKKIITFFLLVLLIFFIAVFFERYRLEQKNENLQENNPDSSKEINF